ncbi:MAG: 1-acyl-sn-glycerol-3-phosphate acyltransferase [Bacteroidales bacterium]|nr:1-acyl-sn-glycerol-3-phosphate acyltransferase [Bacteroidales bacterium]
MQTDFDDIRAYEGEELPAVLGQIMSHPTVRGLLEKIHLPIPEPPYTDAEGQLLIPFLDFLAHTTTQGIELINEQYRPAGKGIYLTNHRNIILDTAFLSLLLYKQGAERPYIGIGNNLYAEPWIEHLVRACKAFTVIRGGSPKELLTHAQHLSAYINMLLAGNHPIWLAQREGRAKDSNDRTATAVLKMLTMAGEGNFLQRVENLNICPVAISYEYDPCDYLKAKEMQLKRDHPDYRKSTQDDVENMKTDMTGFKGHVAYTLTPSINKELAAIAAATTVKNEQVEAVAKLIDRHIHTHYKIYPTNEKALDILQGGSNDFETYIERQIEKIDIEQKDTAFLREKLLYMYANPLINQQDALRKASL